MGGGNGMSETNSGSQTTSKIRTGRSLFDDTFGPLQPCENLTDALRFGAANVSIRRNCGDSSVIDFSIGCSDQNGEGISITPEIELATVENQCASGARSYLDTYSVMIEIGLGAGASRQELFELLWYSRTRNQAISGQNYNLQEFGLQSEIGKFLPTFEIIIQPLSSAGEGLNGAFIFYNAELNPEPGAWSFKRGEPISQTLKFKGLTDTRRNSVGAILRAI
jgi:hypothetical protein